MLYDRKELCKLLNITKDNLKKLEKRKKLEDRLNKNGYDLIKVHKEGRKKTYEVVERKGNNTLLNNIYKYLFKTNNPTKFNEYFIERTSNTDIPVTIQDISNKIKTSNSTVCRWDNKLVESEIIAKDGFFYMKQDLKTGMSYQISKEEFKTYWKNKNDAKILRQLKEKFAEGTISFEEAIRISQQITRLELALEGFYYYKIKKFKLCSDNKLYIDIKDMIESNVL